jgi:apolipoprotein N-acyltransferase
LENDNFWHKLHPEMNTQLKYLLLSLLSAALLVLSWFPMPFWPLAAVGFVPILFLHHYTSQRNDVFSFAAYTYLALLLWNIGTTWWVWFASAGGATAAFVFNSLFMLMPWLLMHLAEKKLGRSKAIWILLSGWLAYEFLHLNWELSWPWLVLGNVFAPVPGLVQWYEYTGQLGGSLWVLLLNIYVFKLWEKRGHLFITRKIFNHAFVLIVVPVFASYYVISQYKPTGRPLNVVVVQPNIDPYEEKFDGLTPSEQLIQLTKLAQSSIDSTTNLVCFPETALVGGINENEFQFEPLIQHIRNWRSQYPNMAILTGMDSYRLFPVWEKTPTSRKYNDQFYYDAYNAALLIDGNGLIEVYHKSKLVPGVEKMPYPQVFGFLEKLAIDMGGTSGSLGSDKEPKVFTLDSRTQIAPVICYESVYGEFVSRYVNKGAGVICIITNDGWWGNTPGYKQHFQYARLRAIETRRWIARSANTGISGFIDDKGNILQQTDWWVADTQKQTLMVNDQLTFYTRNGDYIGIILTIYFVMLLLGWMRIRKPRLS